MTSFLTQNRGEQIIVLFTISRCKIDWKKSFWKSLN